jgi:glycerol uptake facilitator-like aquaporin
VRNRLPISDFHFMKNLRRIHTFLGCFIAPLLLFFVATGWYQTVNPDRKKGEGEADKLVGRLSTVSAQVYHTALFRYLVVVMCAALITTIALGIVLAFRSSRQRWQVWLSQALGILVPMILLWLGQQR